MRLRRQLVTLTMLLAALPGLILGAATAALGTGAGRDALTGALVAIGDGAVTGSVTVGRIDGSLVQGLIAEDVSIRDEHGVPLAEIGRLALRYRLRDLFGGAVVLGQLRLDRPSFSLVQLPGESLNLLHIFGLDQPGDGGGPSPLIAFRDVEINDGSLLIAIPLPDLPGPELERISIRDSTLRVIRVDSLEARIPYLRLASPLPSESGQHFEIAHLRADISDPKLSIQTARGTAELHGDSLALALADFQLPDSRMRVEGAVTWPTGPLLFGLDIDGGRLATADIPSSIQPFPPGLVGWGELEIRSLNEEELSLTIENLSFEGTAAGGKVSGDLEMMLGPGDFWSFEDTELDMERFDLEYLRPLLDTLPLAGRLTGSLQADGPRDRLRIRADWLFADSLVPGWPKTRLVGRGVISLGGPESFVFDRMRLDSARLALPTVRRLVPAIELGGEVLGTGVLRGPWKNLTYQGTLVHRSLEAVESRADGEVRLDTRRDTVGIWGDLQVVPLDFEGLRPTYPTIPLVGEFGGRLELAGYFDSLNLRADLEGSGGHVRVAGQLTLLEGIKRGRELDISFDSLSVYQLLDSLPASRLRGTLTGRFDIDTLAPPRSELNVRLAQSVIGGVSLDSAMALISSTDRLAGVDTAVVWFRRGTVSADGELAWDTTASSMLNVRGDFESISPFGPLLLFAADVDSAGYRDPVLGSGEFYARLQGAWNRFRITGSIGVDSLRWSEVFASGLDAAFDLETDTLGLLDLDATLDSLVFGDFTFGDLEVALQGERDSLDWHGRIRSGSHASAVGWGTAERREEIWSVPVDSLGAFLERHVWLLDERTHLAVSKSGLDFDQFGLTSTDGASRITFSGLLPLEGEGSFDGSLFGVPLEDVYALAQLDPATTSGELSGNLDLRGSAEEPTMVVRLALRNATFNAFRAPYLEMDLDYRDRNLSGTGILWRRSQEILRLNVELPLDLALRPAGPRKLPGEINITARADEVDLAFAEAVTPWVKEAGGRLDADLGISGTWESPILVGGLTISEGRGSFPSLGVRHEAINGRASLVGDTIKVDRLSLTSGGGTARVDGYVRLPELTDPLLNLRIRADRFEAIDVPDFLQLTASGDLSLTGPPFGAVLTGTGTATSGVLYFADLVNKQIVSLEDTLLVDSEIAALIRQENLGPRFENRFLDSLRIDSLGLTMGSDVWLRSSEANIQLVGSIVIAKVLDQYRFDGTLNTPRGTYTLTLGLPGISGLVSRDFSVVRGEVSYLGTEDLDAQLDIEARHVVRNPRRDNVTVLVRLGGTLYEPEVTLSSDVRPPLSQTEIISYLLFGAPSFQAFGSNARWLETGAQELISTFSSQLERSVVSELGLPIDYLTINPGFLQTGSGSAIRRAEVAEIAVGWQLGSRTFVTASPRICASDATDPIFLGASVEYRVSRNWLLAASLDPVRACVTTETTTRDLSYQFGADIFWEKRY